VAEPLRSSHLLPLLAGDKRSGFAFTEPSDAPRPTWAAVDGDRHGRRTRATPCAAGPPAVWPNCIP
jgi:hypothetical protein